MKPIISFDLDMTLLDHSTWKIPESAIRALEALRPNYHIVLATGRDMDNYYSREFKDLIHPDAIIHLNGTKITVGEKVLYRHEMDRELLYRLLTFADEQGYCIGATRGDDDFYIHPEILEQVDLIRWGESGRQYQDPFRLLDLGVQTLAYIDFPEQTKAGADAIEAAFPELKLPLFAGETGADIVERQSSKARGLERLCEHFGTDINECFAFGDSMNDIEIIQAAGHGIAMGNAVEQLKKAADYVTDAIDQDGIWNACRHFRLI